MDQLVNLPWQTQIVIVGGYVGYVVAYTGRRASHKVLDIAAISLCFGGIGLLAMHFTLQKILPGNEWQKVIAGFSAVIAPLIAGVLWRARLRHICQWIIRKISGSEEDGLPTAWDTITQEQGLIYSQINIRLKDGKKLESYLLEDLNKLPNGPCALGGDGSIALYVTHIQEPGEDRREARNMIDGDGARITYIPADQIAEVDFRRAKKAS